MSGRLLYTDSAMEKALRLSRGNRTRAAEILGCAVSTVSSYVQRSEHLQAIERELVESLVDRAEDVVRDHLDGGNLIAAFFTLKTRGKERGWSERIDLNLNADITVTQLSLPPAPTDASTWLSQAIQAEQLVGRLRPVLDLDSIEDAEVVDAETLERVEIKPVDSKNVSNDTGCPSG